MFSDLDSIIFPDSCEVIKVSSQQYVYSIFKNGSNSLSYEQQRQGWTTISADKINDSTVPITVFLRDPRDRFISGVNTFVQHCLRDNPKLDIPTVMHFVKNFLFLNTHYCPQFFWLVNLSRFNSNRIKLQGMTDLAQLTDLKGHAGVVPPTDEFVDSLSDFPWQKLELYFFLDQLLIERIGQEITVAEFVADINQQHPELYKLIFQHTQDLVNVLSKT